VTPVEFRGHLWHEKTRVPGVSFGVVYVILRLAVLVEHRLVTDGRTHRAEKTEKSRPNSTQPMGHPNPWTTLLTVAAAVYIMVK